MYVVQDIRSIMVATTSMKTVMIRIGMIVSGMVQVVLKNHKMNLREVSKVDTWMVTLMPSATQLVQNQKRWKLSNSS